MSRIEPRPLDFWSSDKLTEQSTGCVKNVVCNFLLPKQQKSKRQISSNAQKISIKTEGKNSEAIFSRKMFNKTRSLEFHHNDCGWRQGNSRLEFKPENKTAKTQTKSQV